MEGLTSVPLSRGVIGLPCTLALAIAQRSVILSSTMADVSIELQSSAGIFDTLCIMHMIFNLWPMAATFSDYIRGYTDQVFSI